MIINIEANIAAGKSTFLTLCKNELTKRGYNVVIVNEQVDDWTSTTDSQGVSIFDHYYRNKSKYSYVFQTYVLMSRISTLMRMKQEHQNAVLLCERSFMTDYEVFAKSLYESGDLNDIEWNVYNKWHTYVRSIFKEESSGTVYLRASPDVCIQRVKVRSRQSEDLILYEYIANLHKKHEEWLMRLDEKTGSADKKVLVLNANANILVDPNALMDHVDKVESLILKLADTSSLDASSLRKVPAIV
jgi:deoxyadenosine/deoxycytidine kinase